MRRSKSPRSKSPRRWPKLSVAGQILLLQLGVVVLTVAVGAAITLYQYSRQANSQYCQRALAIARSVATLPAVHTAFDTSSPATEIQPLAESIRKASGATFVVVADEEQIRYSHPDPRRIGLPLSTDAASVLAGRSWVGMQEGTLGRSVRAKVPIRDTTGEIIGVVSVGILQERILDYVRDSLMPTFAISLGIAFILGGTGSYLLARRLKRQTFGLEPGDIAWLFEESQALLHGVREGLVAVDTRERITVANDEAQRLLALTADCIGRRVDDLALPRRLADVLLGNASGDDQIVLRGGRILVFNRMPVTVRGVSNGAVVTLRDRTQLEALQRELDGAHSTTDALRAQAHEFSNQLHTILGLIDSGKYEEAAHFITRTSTTRDQLTATISDRVADPALAALLMSKTVAAAERGIHLCLTEESRVEQLEDSESEVLLTVAGNLVDNAIDALGTTGGWITVDVRTDHDGTWTQVRDSGAGIDPELAGEVFQHGFTTKIAQHGGSRGLGLALIRQACVHRGGWVQVRNDNDADTGGTGRGGAVFTAFLPHARARPRTPAEPGQKHGDKS